MNLTNTQNLARAEYMRKRYLSKKAHILKTQKAWRKKNPDYYRQYYAKHRKELLDYQQKWKAENPESRKAAVNRYTKTFKFKVQQHRRRSKTEVPNDIKPIRDLLRGAKSFICYYCQKRKPRSECQLDHMVPISRGGSHIAANIALSCRTCNLKKYTKLPNEFITVGQLVLL